MKTGTRETLTRTEQKVIVQMCLGLSDREIAEKLENCIERTVSNHVSSILKKLKVANRTQAVIKFQALQNKDTQLEKFTLIPQLSQSEKALHNLPYELSSFVGREKEIDDISTLLQK